MNYYLRLLVQSGRQTDNRQPESDAYELVVSSKIMRCLYVNHKFMYQCPAIMYRIAQWQMMKIIHYIHLILKIPY